MFMPSAFLWFAATKRGDDDARRELERVLGSGPPLHELRDLQDFSEADQQRIWNAAITMMVQ